MLDGISERFALLVVSLLDISLMICLYIVVTGLIISLSFMRNLLFPDSFDRGSTMKFYRQIYSIYSRLDMILGGLFFSLCNL